MPSFCVNMSTTFNELLLNASSRARLPLWNFVSHDYILPRKPKSNWSKPITVLGITRGMGLSA